jgi:hypothetical protein
VKPCRKPSANPPSPSRPHLHLRPARPRRVHRRRRGTTDPTQSGPRPIANALLTSSLRAHDRPRRHGSNMRAPQEHRKSTVDDDGDLNTCKTAGQGRDRCAPGRIRTCDLRIRSGQNSRALDFRAPQGSPCQLLPSNVWCVPASNRRSAGCPSGRGLRWPASRCMECRRRVANSGSLRNIRAPREHPIMDSAERL